MKWSEFKKIVDDRIGDTDPEILYIDVDDGDSLNITTTNPKAPGYLIVTD